MAGSYHHAYNGFEQALENMGDAVETLEEMMWIILSEIGHERAEQALNDGYYPICQGRRKPDEAYLKVQSLVKHYLENREW